MLKARRKVAGSAAEGAITGAVGAATGETSLAASAAGTAAKTAAKTGAKAAQKTLASSAAAGVAGAGADAIPAGAAAKIGKGLAVLNNKSGSYVSASQSPTRQEIISALDGVTVAVQARDQIYLRRSSASLYSDVVHEGTHAFDFFNGVPEREIGCWPGEKGIIVLKDSFK